MTEPRRRCSPRLAKKMQAAPSFADCPSLVLSTIHDILLHGSDDNKGFCRQSGTRDAACFRGTCKAFCDAGLGSLPSTLKLSFVDPPSHQATGSLAYMLSRPAVAAHTQLSLRLCMQFSNNPGNDSSHVEALGDDRSQPWAAPLAALAEHVEKLEMPSLFVNATLSSACEVLPDLEELVLHVGCFSAVESDRNLLSAIEKEESDDSEDTWQSQSQLQSLTLSVPSGQPPFLFVALLDLSELAMIDALVLRGPIVKLDLLGADVTPFAMPEFGFSMQVTIDPGLGGRKPTRWARTLAVFDFYDPKLGPAIPRAKEYREEDEDVRQANIARFRRKAADLACEQAQRDPIGTEALRGYVAFFLEDGNLHRMMQGGGIEGRSDLLETAP